MTTTIKVKFRPSVEGTEGEIYYQLSHGKKQKSCAHITVSSPTNGMQKLKRW